MTSEEPVILGQDEEAIILGQDPQPPTQEPPPITPDDLTIEQKTALALAYASDMGIRDKINKALVASIGTTIYEIWGSFISAHRPNLTPYIHAGHVVAGGGTAYLLYQVMLEDRLVKTPRILAAFSGTLFALSAISSVWALIAGPRDRRFRKLDIAPFMAAKTIR